MINDNLLEKDNVDEIIDKMKIDLREYLLNIGISTDTDEILDTDTTLDIDEILDLYYDYWIGELDYTTFLQILTEYRPEDADMIANEDFVYEGDWVE